MHRFSPVILFFIIPVFFAVGWLTAQPQYLLYSEKKLHQIEKKHGKEVSRRLTDWQAFVIRNQNKPEAEKLQLTNDFFNNQLLWSTDLKLWQKKDYWATPLETLIIQAGDCEDFSIIKYFTLLALGISIKRLKITYVKALKYNQAHMVLTYTQSIGSMPLILDNINKKILPASQRTDLKPAYSFNGDGMWIQRLEKTGKRIGSSSQLRLWVELSQRMQKEL